jgi:hypothetical protein
MCVCEDGDLEQTYWSLGEKRSVNVRVRAMALIKTWSVRYEDLKDLGIPVIEAEACMNEEEDAAWTLTSY